MRLAGPKGVDDGMKKLTWQSWSPTVTSSTGTLTSYTVDEARYRKVGKLLFYAFNIKITNNGTGSGDIRVTLPPHTPAYPSMGAGREFDLTGTMLQCLALSTMFVVWNYDNSYPGATNRRLFCTGFYETS